MILHVRDISHEDTDAQSADVEAILTGLGIDASDHRRLLEVWNKLDLLDADRASMVTNAARRRGANDTRPILVSALTGEGEDRLTAAIEDRLAEGRTVLDLALDPTDGQGLAWLYEHVEVLSRQDGDAAILLQACGWRRSGRSRCGRGFRDLFEKRWKAFWRGRQFFRVDIGEDRS